MNNGNDDDFDDQTRAGTPEELALDEAADAIGRAAKVVEENLRMVRKVPEDHRELFMRKASLLLGELGDLCHEHRRSLIRMKGFYLF